MDGQLGRLEKRASSLCPDEYQKIKVNDMYFRFPARGLVCFRIVDPGILRHPTCENDTNGKLPSQPERLQVGSEGGTMPSPWQELQKWMLHSIDGAHPDALPWDPGVEVPSFFQKVAFSWCGSSCYLHLRLCEGQRIQRDFIGHRRSPSFWGSVLVIFFTIYFPYVLVTMLWDL